jgi:DNA-binding MarR family transcriptional regulator
MNPLDNHFEFVISLNVADINQIDRRLWEVFADSSLMVTRHVDRELRAELDVISDDIAILEDVLAADPDGARMTDLAHRLAAEPRHVTYRIARLDRRGLIARQADPDDGRVTRVHVTAETDVFFALCRARLDELIALYLTDLVPFDRRHDLVNLLAGVVDGYRHHFATPASDPPDQPSVKESP